MQFKHSGRLPRGVKIVKRSLKIKLHVNKSPSALPNISGSLTTKLYYIQKKATFSHTWLQYDFLCRAGTSHQQRPSCSVPPNPKNPPSILGYLVSWYLCTQSSFRYSERIKTDVCGLLFYFCFHLNNIFNHLSSQAFSFLVTSLEKLGLNKKDEDRRTIV